MKNSGASTLKLLAAFATVYLVWGSTYLAIKIAIATLPPFMMASLRYFAAALIIAPWIPKKDYLDLRFIHWKSALTVGGLLFLGGNGGVVWAQQTVPSGIAALVVATVPIWTVLLEWKWTKRTVPTPKVIIGILLGFLGLVFLLNPAKHSGQQIPVMGILVLMLASLSWAVGSIKARVVKLPGNPQLTNALEMLAGGVLLGFVSLIHGDWQQVRWERISVASLAAVGYLVFFGAIIGFTAYKYMLKHTSPTVSATYAYVNPVIAIFLGWIFAGEALSLWTAAGALLTLSGVFLITISSGSRMPLSTGDS